MERHGRSALASRDVAGPDERHGTGSVHLITQRSTDHEPRCPRQEGAIGHRVPNQIRGQPGAVIVKATGGDVDELKAAGLLGVNTALSWCDPTG